MIFFTEEIYGKILAENSNVLLQMVISGSMDRIKLFLNGMSKNITDTFAVARPIGMIHINNFPIKPFEKNHPVEIFVICEIKAIPIVKTKTTEETFAVAMIKSVLTNDIIKDAVSGLTRINFSPIYV